MMTFRDSGGPAKPQQKSKSSDFVEVVFRQPGALGMRFKDDSGHAMLRSVNPSSHAWEHEELQPGLLLLVASVMSVASVPI
jgi:hypothetical protein